MSANRAPKFGKVEILLKGDSMDKSVNALTKLDFDDCGVMITGDYIIVILDEKDEVNNTLTSTGKIFHLSKIDSYKTHAI